MNFVFLSPHFPPNYYQFVIQLRRRGANILGLADEDYHHLQPELQHALVEYYWVSNLHQYDELVRGMGYFTHRYGKIDRVESHNEYWIETEARLRDDFNIFGLKVRDMPPVKQKSVMKKLFQKCGLHTSRGELISSSESARRFTQEVGYPVVVKPDTGVGANATFRINDKDELDDFLIQHPQNYYIEEFVDGKIISFDGLTNRDGQIVFYTSHLFNQGIMEIVNSDSNLFYYSLREIPRDLERAGRKIVKYFQVKERFFHFEFFRTPNGDLIPLEVNMRPPGILTTDMFNFANDIDIYDEYANIVLNNRFDATFSRSFHCAYVGRKYNRSYKSSHTELLSRFGEKIVYHTPIASVFRSAAGDYGYLIRSADLEEIQKIAGVIQTRWRELVYENRIP